MNRLHPLDAALRFVRSVPIALLPPLYSLVQGDPAPLAHTLRQNAALLLLLLAAALARHAAAGWQLTDAGLIQLRFGVLVRRQLVLAPGRLCSAAFRTTLPYRLVGAARVTLTLRGVGRTPGRQLRLVLRRRQANALQAVLAPGLCSRAAPRVRLYLWG